MNVRMFFMADDDLEMENQGGGPGPGPGAPEDRLPCASGIVADLQPDNWFPNAVEALVIVIAVFAVQEVLARYSMAAGRLLFRMAPRAVGGPEAMAGALSEAATLFMLLCYLFVVRKYPAKKLGLTFRPIPLNILRGLGYSIAAFLGGIIFTIFIFSIVGMALMALGWSGAQVTNLFNNLLSTGREKEVMKAVNSPMGFVFSVALAPVFEELVFRGLLYGSLRSVMPAWTAGAACSLVFAGLHFYVIGAPAIFFMSMVSCLAYERNRSIAPCIAMHGLWNLRTFIMAAPWFHL